VTWLQGSAHNPSTFHDALANADGVVHTLGTLIEDGGKYKQAIREGNIPQVLGAVCDNVLSGKNPLMKGGEGSYEHINRDSGAFPTGSSCFVYNDMDPLQHYVFVRPLCPLDKARHMRRRHVRLYTSPQKMCSGLSSPPDTSRQNVRLRRESKHC